MKTEKKRKFLFIVGKGKIRHAKTMTEILSLALQLILHLFNLISGRPRGKADIAAFIYEQFKPLVNCIYIIFFRI